MLNGTDNPAITAFDAAARALDTRPEPAMNALVAADNHAGLSALRDAETHLERAARRLERDLGRDAPLARLGRAWLAATREYIRDRYPVGIRTVLRQAVRA